MMTEPQGSSPATLDLAGQLASLRTAQAELREQVEQLRRDFEAIKTQAGRRGAGGTVWGKVLLVFLGFVLLLLAGWLTLRLVSGYDAISPESVGRVQVGMSLFEVEAIFGRPPDDTETVAELPPGEEGATARVCYWDDPRATAVVEFDARGRVVRKEFEHDHRGGALERFLDWLGL